MSDLDLFDDIFFQPSTQQAANKPRGKFLPKAKKKAGPVMLPPTSSDASLSNNEAILQEDIALQSDKQKSEKEDAVKPSQERPDVPNLQPAFINYSVCDAPGNDLTEKTMHNVQPEAQGFEYERKLPVTSEKTVLPDLDSTADIVSEAFANSTLESLPVYPSCVLPITQEHEAFVEAPVCGTTCLSVDLALKTDQGLSRQEGNESFSNVDILDDFIFQPPTATVKTISKFQPKGNMRDRSKKLLSLPASAPHDMDSIGAPILGSCSSTPTKSANFPPHEPAMNEETPVETMDTAVPTTSESHNINLFHADSATNAFSVSEDSRFFGPQDDGYQEIPSTSSVMECSSNLVMAEGSAFGTLDADFVSSDRNRDSVTENGMLDTEEAADFLGLEPLDDILSQPLANIARGSGKFRPKAKARVKNTLSVEPITSPSTVDTVTQKGLSSTYQSELHADSSIRDENSHGSHATIQGKGVGREKASLQSKETAKKVNFQKDDGLPQGKTVTVTVSGTCEDVIGSSRRTRSQTAVNMRTIELEDIDEESERFNTSEMDEEYSRYYEDDEYGAEISMCKKAPRKPKGSPEVSGSPSRKRKKAHDEPDSAKQDPPKKKFSHSTRQNRRQVDKVLLETPEEDINSKKLRIKDLIRLTEIRERMSMKGAPLEQSYINTSASHGSYDYHYDEDSAYAEGQDLNRDDEETIPAVKLCSTKLNYHTYMNKSRSERWSKTDTEMFYQAIRQFGTDFAMIQQLFPNRTRHQVKLKFKNEERKHPLQVADALVHRSKDHSHFELVIRQLEANAEQNDEPAVSESQDATAVNEDEEIKKSEGEDEGANGFDYGHSPVKYNDEHVFDFDNFENGDGSSFYDAGEDDFDGDFS